MDSIENDALPTRGLGRPVETSQEIVSLPMPSGMSQRSRRVMVVARKDATPSSACCAAAIVLRSTPGIWEVMAEIPALDRVSTRPGAIPTPESESKDDS